MVHAERRSGPRAPVDRAATVHLGNEELRCQAHNVSASGFALISSVAGAPGCFVRINLALAEGSRPIDVDGVLVRTEPRGDEQLWGVEIFPPPPGVAAQIEGYLRWRLRAASEACDTAAPEESTARRAGRGEGVEPRPGAESPPRRRAAARQRPPLRPGQRLTELDRELKDLYGQAIVSLGLASDRAKRRKAEEGERKPKAKK